MDTTRGKGNHGLPVSEDIINFLTHCLESSHYRYEATLKAGIDHRNIMRIIEQKRAHAATIEKIKANMQKQEVC